MRRVVIATRNEAKRRELARYLSKLGVTITSLAAMKGVPQVVEDGRTFKANARKKALTVSRITDAVVLADDSGLSVDALGGRPGVWSARYAGEDADDLANNKKLLGELDGMPAPKRGAAFICAIAIAHHGKIIADIEAQCRGKIAFKAAGRHGFGYDPLFIVRPYGRTFGQLGLRVKDRMSHRAKALKKACVFLKRYLAAST
jgi:XTP/dITP diphosphohydrolase